MTRRAKQDLDLMEFGQDVELEEILENLGDEAYKAWIYKFEKGGDLGFVDTVSAQGLTIENIREYGPGKYQVKIKREDGTYLKTRTIMIAETMKAVGQTVSKDNGLDRELMLALIANMKPAPAVDIGGLLQGMAAMKPKEPDLATLIAAIAGLMPKTDKEDWLAKTQQIVALAKDLAPPSTGEENLYSVAKDLGTKVVDAIKPGLQRLQSPPPQAVIPATVTAAQPIPQTDQDQQNMLPQWIRTQLTFLKQKALADKDPEAWAEYILDNTEEPGCRAIVYVMEQQATFENLLEFDLEIGQNPVLRAWFEKLYGVLHAELFSPLPTPLDTAGPGGHPPNPSGNAGPGPAAESTGAVGGAKPPKRGKP